MKLIVVRHGETNCNVDRVMSFKPGKHCYLTYKGIEQAREVREELADQQWDATYISELYRTEQTAVILNEDRGVPLIIDPRINEIRSGIEGQQYKEYQRNPSPAAESHEELAVRVRSFLDDLKQSSHDSVLVISHFAVIKSLSILLGEEINHIKNCSVHIFEL